MSGENEGKLISAGELKGKLEGEEKEKILLVDVRRPEEREEKGIIQFSSQVNIEIKDIEEGDGLQKIHDMVSNSESEHYGKTVVCY
mmetsp:Transcript_40076/g.63375  ORF Transcript_40076/g.63375 Transcript_40076/m.63375 type:complete len:86 (+) Transcript_40076:109-366(+)|eukprot:CAMPEP_0201523626 /NCGR_PEP_ID=MMETSP0161_2-20130828/20591_1 /ASSEMBLY_ACC=CAM_ASM_000251 /TAXON_ID=180227 /ORGANISM="Neoparamoeba aestuarina, Strain SoJaBio B1-5/56/2" /LENGTH=85 /DNA_ID=CAMNT_0047922805 /DNA_START=105 /DNA_END=362 /DNA_ORIENTATION=+